MATRTNRRRADAERGPDGRYGREVTCDGCGRPIGGDEFYTDEEVCGGGDGPGFYLCQRKSCGQRHEGLPVGDRRVLFTAQRAENRAARDEGRRARAVQAVHP